MDDFIYHCNNSGGLMRFGRKWTDGEKTLLKTHLIDAGYDGENNEDVDWNRLAELFHRRRSQLVAMAKRLFEAYEPTFYENSIPVSEQSQKADKILFDIGVRYDMCAHRPSAMILRVSRT